MAAEHMRSGVEVRPSHSVDLCHTCSRYRFDTVDWTGNVLRVIEGIVEIRSELDLSPAFTDAKILKDREIQILDRR